MTGQPSNAVAEASDWSGDMAKVIEFHLRGPVPKKVKPAPTEQRGKLVRNLPVSTETESIGRYRSHPVQHF